jgi:hypothetical protein
MLRNNKMIIIIINNSNNQMMFNKPLKILMTIKRILMKLRKNIFSVKMVQLKVSQF